MLGLFLTLPLIFGQVAAPAAGNAPAAAPAGGAAVAQAAPPAGGAAAPAAPGATPNSASPLSTLLPLLPIPILFYFLMIRPQQQQEKKRKGMIDAMKRNDRVMTAGGIYGTVVGINNDQDTVMLRVDDDRGVKMEFTRASIVKVIDSSSEKKGEASKEV